jgi:REP element-mobilizing transposase RayT
MGKHPQLTLDLAPAFGWGGRRAGAGRRPEGEEPGISHRRELHVDRHIPAHVTLRVREHVWNLRSQRSFALVASALRGVRDRSDFRVVHFSVQGDHVHDIVEADDARALANGMRAFSGRLALGLNRMMGRTGAVFEDRYHAHTLRNLTEARNAIAYVLGNFASHVDRSGGGVESSFVDPYSSAGPAGSRLVSSPESWLLRAAARRPD